MQCVVCGKVYPDSQDSCPRCPTLNTASAEAVSPSPEEKSMPTSTSQERKTAKASSRAATETKAGATAGDSSRLIEFPGVPTKPQWRKELSERVREIQQRRVLEAEREASVSPPPSPQGHNAAGAVGAANTGASAEAAAPPLGLVPPPPKAPQPNPLVVAALKRIERARQQSNPPPMPRASRGGAAAAAVAHYVEEDYQAATDPALVSDQLISPAFNAQAEQAVVVDKIEKPLEATRPSPLAIVPPAQVTNTAEESCSTQTKARRHIPVVADDAALSQIEARMHAAVLSNHSQADIITTDDNAPVSKRIAGGVVDLLVVGFAATPFAAIIELTNGNWADVRVAASMCGIVVVLMFLYLMAATALAGRTWGMSLVSLRTVDAVTGMAPTTGQCVRRAIGYMFSLATLGVGLLYAFFDAEGRAAHDHLSGTIVITE